MRHLAKLDELRFFLGICGALPQICMRCSQQLSFAAVVFFLHLAERFCSGRFFCFRCYGFTKCEVTRVLLRSRALPARNGAVAAGNPCSPRGQYSLAGMFPIDIKIDLRE